MINVKSLCVAFALLLATTATHAQIVYRTTYGPTVERAEWLYGMSITYDIGKLETNLTTKKIDPRELPERATLNAVTFFKTDRPTDSGATQVHLHVYDDFATGNDQLPMRIGNLLGVSANRVNIPDVVEGKPMNWYFKDVELEKGHEYHFILATDKEPATIENYANLAMSAFKLNVGNPYPGGRVWKGQGGVNLDSTNWDMEFEMSWSPAKKKSRRPRRCNRIKRRRRSLQMAQSLLY